MIEKLSQDFERFPLGSVSISVDDLIKIIESHSFKDVSAVNGDTKFTDLDDLKKHKTMLAGYPEISCDTINISFSRYTPQITAYLYKDQKSSKIAESVRNQVYDLKNPLDRIKDKSRWYHTAIVFIIIGIQLANSGNKLFPEGGYESKIISYLFNIIIPLYIFMTAWNFYAEMIRKPIRSRPGGGFIRNNMERIFMLAVGSVITLLVAQLGKFLFGGG